MTDQHDPFADAPPGVLEMLNRLPPNLQAAIRAKKAEFDQHHREQGEQHATDLTQLIDQEAPDIVRRGIEFTSESTDPGALVPLMCLVLGEALKVKVELRQTKKDLENLRKSHEAWISDL